MMSALKIGASSYRTGMRDEVRSPVLRTPIVATAGISADDETRSVEQTSRCQRERELGESNVEIGALRRSMVSLQLENQHNRTLPFTKAAMYPNGMSTQSTLTLRKGTKSL